MRSSHADVFNHDDEAAGYDADVRNEAHPIRAGYDALLDWVVETADVQALETVLELGSGTGNLTDRLPSCRHIACVDISENMMGIARAKLSDRAEVRYSTSDLLEWMSTTTGSYDVVVSTYAIHHLTDAEKTTLFKTAADRLSPKGRMIFGDLMFEDASTRTAILAGYREAGQVELANDIEDEFFWNVAAAATELEALNLRVKTTQFSDLSWGIAAERKPATN